jgi:AraC family transcriptional regulator
MDSSQPAPSADVDRPYALPAGIYLGTKNRSCEVGRFLLSEHQYGGKAVIPKHYHERTFISFMLRGSWHESYGSKSRERNPHTLAIHPAGEVHSELIGGGGSSAFQVEFSDEWLRNLDKHAAVFAEPSQIESGLSTRLALRLYAEFQQIDSDSSLIIEGLLLEGVGRLSRDANRLRERLPPSWLVRANDIIEARSSEQLSIEAIARDVGVHPVTLSRMFRRQFGCSIGEHLRDLRVERACQELMTSDRSVAEIAVAVGFYDQSHLCRVMRERTGLTPAAFRAGRGIAKGGDVLP